MNGRVSENVAFFREENRHFLLEWGSSKDGLESNSGSLPRKKPENERKIYFLKSVFLKMFFVSQGAPDACKYKRVFRHIICRLLKWNRWYSIFFCSIFDPTIHKVKKTQKPKQPHVECTLQKCDFVTEFVLTYLYFGPSSLH